MVEMLSDICYIIKLIISKTYYIANLQMALHKKKTLEASFSSNIVIYDLYMNMFSESESELIGLILIQ